MRALLCTGAVILTAAILGTAVATLMWVTSADLHHADILDPHGLGGDGR